MTIRYRPLRAVPVPTSGRRAPNFPSGVSSIKQTPIGRVFDCTMSISAICPVADTEETVVRLLGDEARPDARTARTGGVTNMAIDIAFDFRTDADGKDPDSHSPTLRRYHRLLWSKPLPCGACFDLSDTIPGVYLDHSSALGKFFLSSDSVIPTFTRWPALKPITEQLSESENEAFRTIGYTIGGMMVFPGNQIDRKWTINRARGCNRSISDRFDLTLECIRRHYADQGNPLAVTLARYAAFFALFGDFRGYVSFFLLDDLVTEDLSVRFFMPFDDFRPPSVPKDVGTYKEYRRRSIEFIEARNHRIKQLDI